MGKRKRLCYDEYLYNAHCALAAGSTEQAIELFCLAIQQCSDGVAAIGGLGLALLSQQKMAEAETCFRRTIDLEPEQADGYNNLALVFMDTERMTQAEECLRIAGTLAPNCEAVCNNWGLALEELCRMSEAEAQYRNAIRLNDGYAQAYYNLGNLLKSEQRWGEAEECLNRAVALLPDYADACYSLAALQLLQGNFSAGWPAYDAWRMRRPTKRGHGIARWRGESLAGKRILLYYEQGFGDVIQFVRYAKLVAQKEGASVTLWLPPELAELFDDYVGTAQIYSGLERPQEMFDYACPLPSLPAVFGSEECSIPRTVPYAKPTLEALKRWESKISPSMRLNVGVVWAGNPKHHNDAKRSIDPEVFSHLIDSCSLDWYSLQLGGQSSRVSSTIIDLSSELKSFAQTAAAVMQLDLVISVDSAVAHLAGALGVEVWLLVPFLPDWRWQLEREDSVWYPTMRLFRQARAGDWDEVLQRVQEALAKKVKNVNKIY